MIFFSSDHGSDLEGNISYPLPSFTREKVGPLTVGIAMGRKLFLVFHKATEKQAF